jgi:hypothetical protein
MTTLSAGKKATGQGAWRELAMRQGEAYEAYGRALKGFGQGSLPAEALARDAVDLTARGMADAVNISLRFAEDYYRWAWSLVGITADPEGEQLGEPEAHTPKTADSEGEQLAEPEAHTPKTRSSSPRTAREKG